MHPTIQVIADAVKDHGEAEGPEVMIGDLEDLLSDAWFLMTKEQRKQFMKMSGVENLSIATASEDLSVMHLFPEPKDVE